MTNREWLNNLNDIEFSKIITGDLFGKLFNICEDRQPCVYEGCYTCLADWLGKIHTNKSVDELNLVEADAIRERLAELEKLAKIKNNNTDGELDWQKEM